MNALRVLGSVCLTTLLSVSSLWAQGQKYALVIGVDHYENPGAMKQPDLKYADSDAQALAQALEAGGTPRDNIVLLTTARSTPERLRPRAENIARELKGLAAKCRSGDALVVIYAGYERQFAGSDDYFLCPSDANPANRASLVALSTLYEYLGPCKADLKLVMSDSCRLAEKPGRSGALRPKQPPKGVSVWFACSAGEAAFEDSKIQHGVFSHFLLEGLGGAADADKDGKVTLAELEKFVRPQVKDFARTKLNEGQTPERLGKTEDDLPLAVVRGLRKVEP